MIEIRKLTIVGGYKILIVEFAFKYEFLRVHMFDAELGLAFLEKDDYRDILVEKGMMTSERKKVEGHQGFAATPVRMTRARARTLKDSFPNKKQKTGGFSCQQCKNFWKTERGFSNHKCR